MFDLSALMKALPVSALEPDSVASIDGFIAVPKGQEWRESIWLLEPPAGQHVPYIEPVKTLDKLMRSQGIAPNEAQARAHEAVARMRDDVEEARWVNFFDSLEPESPECLPVSDFVAWLRGEVLVPADIADFFEQAAEVAASTPMFSGADNWEAPWALENLPALPPPHAMIEFVPGAPWADFEWNIENNPFLAWRDAIRPVALELEKALGESVYYFADLNCDIDDDYVHRFLVLHWCCTYKPESAFVKYLLKVSGARDVEELKAALIDPANYTQPFKINWAFSGLEAQWCDIDYLPPGKRKTVAVLFSTPEARDAARALLRQRIRAHVVIIAPKELTTDEWVEQATRYCSGCTLWYLDEHTLDRQPIEILASADELCVIANEKTPNSGFDLKLSEGAENLLWLALALRVEAHYFYINRMELANPDTCLKERGVPERVAARKAQRTAFTRQLKELRLDTDFYSSGLWNERGQMLGYDLLDLPFPLVKRIAAWQRDFDETIDPPDMGDDAWRQRHRQEKVEIAKELQTTLGTGTAVKLYGGEGWLTVDEIEGEP